MGRIIALHSYKGGTGRTLLSINLAMIYANQGKGVCLIDLDFRSPSLYHAFKTSAPQRRSSYWFNDYLKGDVEIQNALVDVTGKYVEKGKLLLGLANPSTEAIRDIESMDRRWHMRALGRILSLKTSLIQDMGLDYVILDASSGLSFSAINAIVSADLVLVLMTTDPSGVKGTWRMTHELYELFDKKTFLIMNRVLMASTAQRALAKRLKKTHNPFVLDIIPCLCDVLEAGGTHMFTAQPDHPFMKKLEIIAVKIESS